MKTVYSSDELKAYLNQGEKQFLAGNQKMKVSFNVYRALGHKGRSEIVEKGSSYGKEDLKNSINLVSEPTLIALSIVFCTTIIAVVLTLSGRKGTVKPSLNGPILTVE